MNINSIETALEAVATNSSHVGHCDPKGESLLSLCAIHRFVHVAGHPVIISATQEAINVIREKLCGYNHSVAVELDIALGRFYPGITSARQAPVMQYHAALDYADIIAAAAWCQVLDGVCFVVEMFVNAYPHFVCDIELIDACSRLRYIAADIRDAASTTAAEITRREK